MSPSEEEQFREELNRSSPYVSVVVPIFNEQDSIPILVEKVGTVLGNLGKPYEIIFVDDGSNDNSFELLKSISRQQREVKVIRFKKNFGQTAALMAGFDYARGEIIVTLDGDLQNDPTDIPGLLQELNSGYDIVSGWRKKRKDKITRRIPSVFANWFISKLTRVKLHDYGCTLKAYRREVVKNLHLYGEMHRFIPAIAAQDGARIGELEVTHHPRKFGKTKYTSPRTIKVILDLITVKFLGSYLTRPLQIFGLLGGVFGLIGFILAIYLSILKLFFQEQLSRRPLLLLAVLLMVIGVQFISLGLIGEIITRIYYETKDKKIYSVKEVINQ